MIVAVIGGAGFIGTRLSHRLQRAGRAPFVIVDKVASRYYPELSKVADVRDLATLRLQIPEQSVLINLAAEHRDDVSPRSLYSEVNVEGARNICSVARQRNVSTIVFTSSVAVYGFSPMGTNESGAINPFNDYGRTKFAAEQIFREWQREDPKRRTLTIVRPTVVFGEQNRGNVYNLLRQIASGRFLMVGPGTNRKSMAYVENVAAFIEHAMRFEPGVHVYNYVDKPDFSINELVALVRSLLGKSASMRLRLPYGLGVLIGMAFDLVAKVAGRKFAVSAIRVKKFCSNSVFDTAVESSGFTAPVRLEAGLRQTVEHEFVDPQGAGDVFYSE
jgi:nucleoside-diphosphate-sugar epimerase